MLRKLLCAVIMAGIFSGCSTKPIEPLTRQKPINSMAYPGEYETAKSVAALPGVYVRNMEKAGLCRVDKIALIKWILDEK